MMEVYLQSCLKPGPNRDQLSFLGAMIQRENNCTGVSRKSHF